MGRKEKWGSLMKNSCKISLAVPTARPTPQPTPRSTAPALDCDDEQSKLGYVPRRVTLLEENEPFLIGELTHYNCPINPGPSLELVELQIPINLAALGVQRNASVRFELEIDETSNVDDVRDCPYPSSEPCSDRLRWTSLETRDSFVVDGQRFTLRLLGFSSTPDMFLPLSYFYSNERATNRVYLIAELELGPQCPQGFDDCGVCGGDGTTCAPPGCDGVRGSGLVLDQCGVCGGSNECIDCRGVLRGSARYDRCDVCNGNGRSCLDCRGVPFGSAQYDRCDICNGSGMLRGG